MTLRCIRHRLRKHPQHHPKSQIPQRSLQEPASLQPHQGFQFYISLQQQRSSFWSRTHGQTPNILRIISIPSIPSIITTLVKATPLAFPPTPWSPTQSLRDRLWIWLRHRALRPTLSTPPIDLVLTPETMTDQESFEHFVPPTFSIQFGEIDLLSSDVALSRRIRGQGVRGGRSSTLPYAELTSTPNTTYFCYFRRVMHVSTYASRGLGLCKYVYMKEAWIASFSNEHFYRVMRQRGRFSNKHSGSFANKDNE